MAITNFIPALWSAATLERWIAENVFAALVDRRYEGLATKGNTVHITGVVPPTVKDYAAAGRITSADAITDTRVSLVIDQEKSVDFYVDDIDAAQAAGSLADYTTAAGDALLADSDTFIANKLVQDGNVLPYTAVTTGDNAFNVFRDATVQLNKNNVPNSGRVCVMNAAFAGLLQGADSKLTEFQKAGDNNGLRNGTIGQLLNIRVVMSNNLPEVVSPQAVFFHPTAYAFVSQIDEVEGMRAQNKFADRIRMLHVYGGKVVKPEGVLVFNELGT